jgi:signal transduction histidine kinase
VPAWAPRLRSIVTDGSDLEHERTAAPWDLWRRGTRLADGHPLVADTTVAVLVAVISVAWFVGHSRFGHTIWFIQAALIVPLAWRRRYPVTVFSFISLVALVQWAAGAELVADVALLVALYTVASHRPRGVAVTAGIVVEVGAVMASFRWSLAGSWPRSLVFLSGLAAAAFLLGTNLRSRRARLAALTERAARLERERDQQALIAAAAERTRIAREMHDVIAHTLAVIISLADGATAKFYSDPDRAASAIHTVSSIGRQALGDTRRLLGVLRAEDHFDGLGPQPGVAQIDALVDQVRSTGLGASLTVQGEARPLPAGAGLTAYRIVQEAITNSLKHAVGATEVAVVLFYGHDVLEIRVGDDGHPLGLAVDGHSGLSNGGHGLAGMRERAAVSNGSVVAGPTPQGWAVHARLPMAPLDLSHLALPSPTSADGNLRVAG